jgi:hypothetical protein
MAGQMKGWIVGKDGGSDTEGDNWAVGIPWLDFNGGVLGEGLDTNMPFNFEPSLLLPSKPRDLSVRAVEMLCPFLFRDDFWD